MRTLVEAVDRLADSPFEQAKALRPSAKAAERSVAVSEELMAIQKQNLAVTAALEAKLASSC